MKNPGFLSFLLAFIPCFFRTCTLQETFFVSSDKYQVLPKFGNSHLALQMRGEFSRRSRSTVCRRTRTFRDEEGLQAEKREGLDVLECPLEMGPNLQPHWFATPTMLGLSRPTECGGDETHVGEAGKCEETFVKSRP